jgi:hypothetical protein
MYYIIRGLFMNFTSDLRLIFHPNRNGIPICFEHFVLLLIALQVEQFH